MNFLAHLHIAQHTNTSFVGNFLGDFVKGDPQGKFNQEIVTGIRLHRFVDAYIDQHDLVRSTKPLFSQELRRYSPIALDMFWDHCLAKHWLEFHQLSLADFCQRAQLQVEQESALEKNELPERFNKVSNLVWQGKWLQSYAQIENIQYGLQRMSLRSKRMGPLALTGETLVENYDFLSELFFQVYPDVLQKSKQFIEKV